LSFVYTYNKLQYRKIVPQEKEKKEKRKRKEKQQQQANKQHLDRCSLVSCDPLIKVGVSKVETPIHDNVRELVTWECKEHGVKS
jgi:hypothetical protein